MFRQSLFAGIPRQCGSVDADLLNSTFNNPFGISKVGANQFIVSDTKNDVLRLINLDRDIVQTVETSMLNRPKGIYKHKNNLYVCEYYGSSIKILDGETGDLKMLTGFNPGYEDGLLRYARLEKPSDVTVSPADGVIYIADQGNHCIRFIQGKNVGTLCGTNKPGYVDKINELHGISMFNSPTNVLTLKSGNLLVCDTGNNALRHVHVGARLVTTVIAPPGKNQFFHHCTRFQFNEHHDDNSIEERDRYHLFSTYFHSNTNINEMGKYFRRPTAIGQLSDQSIICACAGGELWHINNRMDDAVLIKNVVFGYISCILPIENNVILAVDSLYSCIYKLLYSPGATNVNQTIINSSRSLNFTRGATLNKTGTYNTMRGSTMGLTTTYGNNLYDMNKSRNESGLVNTGRSEAKKVQYALEMMKREGNQESKLQGPCIDLSELIDLDKLVQLIADTSEYIELNKLDESQQNFLVSLFKSLKRPINGLGNTSVMLQQLFVRHVLTCCKKFDKMQILKGIAMMNNFAFGISLTDEAELQHFVLDDRSVFIGPLTDVLVFKITLVVGLWLGGPFRMLCMRIKDSQGTVLHEEPRYNISEARYMDMYYPNHQFVQYATTMSQQLHFSSIIEQHKDNNDKFKAEFYVELVEIDEDTGAERIWSAKQYQIRLQLELPSPDQIESLVGNKIASQENLVLFQYYSGY